MGTEAAVAQLYIATYDRAPDATGLAYWVDKIDNQGWTIEDVAESFFDQDETAAMYPVSLSNEDFITQIYLNVLDREPDEAGGTYWLAELEAGFPRNDMIIAILNAVNAGSSAQDLALLNNKTEVGLYYADSWRDDVANATSALVGVTTDYQTVIDAKALIDQMPGGHVPGTDFNLEVEMVAGAESMRITGDMEARIDLTRDDDQVKGLDLDGSGRIDNDGVENNDPTDLDDGHDFAVVDAYRRDQFNDSNKAENYLGDIAFDGTGNDGDGVSTDGNIYLGGLGVDTAFGGIGNDFMVGGGIAQDRFTYDASLGGFIDNLVGGIITGNITDALVTGTHDTLSGGRNADFFFAEISALDNVDGNNLLIDGGNTTDDSVVHGDTLQDSDWILFEGSDDDEPVLIDLSGATIGGLIGPGGEEDQAIITRSGEYVVMREIEHVDASGNLYGFIDDVDVALGGQTDPNAGVGIGSSAQLEIYGSYYDNILIGGFDNDYIDGEEGNDLLFGGNMNFLNNPNLEGIVNDGIDYLNGAEGDDHLVWEVDGGTYDGDSGHDTLWLTELAFGSQSASDLLADHPVPGVPGSGSYVVRLDLAADAGDGRDEGGLFIDAPVRDGSNGYGGADRSPGSGFHSETDDQTWYQDESNATHVEEIEHVNATGLGAVDYFAAGTNDPDLVFNNQQNFLGIDVELDLRGTYGEGEEKSYTFENAADHDGGEDDEHEEYLHYAFGEGQFDGEKDEQGGSTVYYDNWDGYNILLANNGNDNLEGRTGNDILMGGQGNDDFIFSLGSDQSEGQPRRARGPAYIDSGDGLNVIQRAQDADGDNIWDGYDVSTGMGDWGRDFGLDNDTSVGESSLRITIRGDAGGELGDVVNSVISIRTAVYVTDPAGDFWDPIELQTPEIQAAATYAELLTAVQGALAGLSNPDYAENLTATLAADGVTIVITDAEGRELADTVDEGGEVILSLPADSDTQTRMVFGPGEISVSEDRLIFAAYEDRRDGELRDDDGFIDAVGDPVELGGTNYAEDLVVSFAENGTTLTEQQVWCLHFDNLAEEDIVSITVNGVTYTAQVGRSPNLTNEAGDYNNANGSFTGFLERFALLINNQDDDMLGGSLKVAVINGDTLVIDQIDYNGGEAIFMHEPTVDIQNLSGGQGAGVQVMETSSTSVLLLDFDGRDAALHKDNVLFLGNAGMDLGEVTDPTKSRSVLETAKAAGGALIGSDAITIDSIIDVNGLDNDYALHGDDLLVSGAGNDVVAGLTGDDRVFASVGVDTADG
ncbi:MAG: hypothetical protein DRR06_13965, partial [Gammaproteobacteria bacterium]